MIRMGRTGIEHTETTHQVEVTNPDKMNMTANFDSDIANRQSDSKNDTMYATNTKRQVLMSTGFEK